MDHVVVRLSGEITSANAGRIGTHLQDVLRARPVLLEVDLGKVTYLSSDGSAVFFTALLAARLQGTRMIATHVRRQPLDRLNELGLVRVLDVYEGDGPAGSGRGGQ